MEQDGTRTGPPKDIKKITDNIWEIPSSFKPGMRVPARIIASQKILNEMDSGVYNQIANVATLPGITKNALCMPDGHWGYGFPIGGVAAFDINDGGVISPGGIGFDVNCLVRDSQVLTEFGYTKSIQDFESDVTDVESNGFLIQQCTSTLISFDKNAKGLYAKPAPAFMKRKHSGSVIQLKTNLGYEITATADHPILTKNGMVPAGQLHDHEIAIFPFRGVKYEEPSDLQIVGEESFNPSERSELTKRNLLPLKINNPLIPILAKLFGYLLGDGNIYFSNGQGFVCAYGTQEDLLEMKRDVERLGFSAQVYGRTRDHSIPTKYGVVKVTSTNHELHISSRSLANLFYTLGYPRGIKTITPFIIPLWIMQSPLWIKRLFLSGLFGAEMSTPKTHTKTGFYCPTFQMNKNSEQLENGRAFFIQVMSLLEEFNIKTHQLVDFEDFHNKHGKTHTIRLQISAEEDNLVRLWGAVGFSYNQKRSKYANIAISYIKTKKQLTSERDFIIKRIKELKAMGLNMHEVVKLLQSNFTNKRFIQRHYKEDLPARISIDFLSFKEFMQQKEIELGEYGCIFDKINSIKQREYNDYVYDFTVQDTHTFIADGVIVSNCGMRLVLTNLTLKDVKPHIKQLVDRLYERIPAGVGGSGFVKLTQEQFKKVLMEGAHWAVPNGYGWDEDLERTELNGCANWADITKVSEKAIKRGFNQIGTLGSGNHYLEIQHVTKENIKDARLAKKWGLFEDQIVIMFHTGSRGEGHQIATDYLQVFLQVMEKKYGIKILDRELACAPFNSPEGQEYYKAMACAVNFSFANRQTILHRLREVFSETFKQDAEKLGMRQVFDIAHNRATLEKHNVDGKVKELLVHRKGATASYYPGRSEIPKLYRDDGSPVIIGGSMETGSYLLVGAEGASETFCSTAHGSGRTMSRAQAKRTWRGDVLLKELEQKGIYIRSTSYSGAAEEAGGAYKDVDEVINTTHNAGISRKVCKFLPIGNVKG